MMHQRVPLLLWCLAAGILAFVLLDFWKARNSPAYVKFERQWASDVRLLEESGKLPRAWQDIREIEIFGGTPETKSWLKRIKVPVTQKNENGRHKLEILVVLWEENGQRGTMIQYDLVDLKSGNCIWKLGRTLKLNRPDFLSDLKNLVNPPHQ